MGDKKRWSQSRVLTGFEIWLMKEGVSLALVGLVFGALVWGLGCGRVGFHHLGLWA